MPATFLGHPQVTQQRPGTDRDSTGRVARDTDILTFDLWKSEEQHARYPHAEVGFQSVSEAKLLPINSPDFLSSLCKSPPLHGIKDPQTHYFGKLDANGNCM